MRTVDRRAGNGRQRVRLNRTVFLLLVGTAAAVGVAKLSGPLKTVWHQQQDLARLREERAALATEWTRLQALKRHLASDEGQEQAARRAGYVRPGERRLVFVRDPEEAAETPGAAEGSRAASAASGDRDP
jgi:cell division protein FtsB